MYIEFQLPQSDDGLTAIYAAGTIHRHLATWAEKYKLKYKTKTIKYTIRVTFDLDEDYTLFGLTWVHDTHHPSWTSYRLVIDLNNKI